jgi:hypothetical protein
MGFNRPCLDCGALTNKGNRCQPHQSAYLTKWNNKYKKDRPHYSGDYAKRAKIVRQNAEVCWICKEAYKPNDPWTADHVFPGVIDSPLLPAHRSCNSRRGNNPHPSNGGVA